MSHVFIVEISDEDMVSIMRNTNGHGGLPALAIEQIVERVVLKMGEKPDEIKVIWVRGG